MPLPPGSPRSVALVGMMGSGKTTLGRAVAALLQRPFVDTDQAIERLAGMSIPEFFQRFGEPRFRELEHEVLAQSARAPKQILATGGGAFASRTTRDLLLEQCLTVWIDTDEDILLDRVKKAWATRPLLHDADVGAQASQLLAERRQSYSLAHLRFRPDKASVSANAHALARILSEARE